MTRGLKLLLILEALVCFGPAALFLPIGAMMIPMQIMAVIEEPLLWEGPLLVIGSVGCGIVGVCTMFFVLLKLLGNGRIERPLPVLVGAAFGVAGIFIATGGMRVDLPWTIVYALPLLATAHILFLARRRFVWPLIKPNATSQLWICLVPPALLGIAALVTVERADQSLDELKERYATWLLAKPGTYSYEQQFAGWIAPPEMLLPKRITVRDREIVSAVHTYVPGPGESPELPPARESAWTMDTIFDELIEAKAHGARVRARFDERWGFVEKAHVEIRAPDSSWDLTIRGFEPEGTPSRR